MVNNTNGELGIPPVNLDMYKDVKLLHDCYEVYVNGDFVGKKTLLAQNEDILQLADYLSQAGFTGFTTELRGDQFLINTDNPAKAAEIKDALNVYLHIR